jgi:Tol biopolymer transport system component
MRQLTNDTYKDRRPRWSPDGRRILFDSNRSGRNELWQIGFDGGSLTQITRTTELPTMQGVWSPNGKELAFSRPGSVPGILQLSSSVVISLDRLASHESWAGVNSWSPDGALLAFHSVTNFQGPRGIGIYPVKDGQVVQLRDVGAAPSWLADSRRLLYETGAELHLLDTVSHVDRIIMRTAPYELELGTRAGGVRDWIYYSLISRQADIWSFELH